MNLCTFPNKDSFKSLKHLEDVARVHTAIIITITDLEHQLDLLVLGNSRQKVASHKEIYYIHLLHLLNPLEAFANF